jgi:hypothetical protein
MSQPNVNDVNHVNHDFASEEQIAPENPIDDVREDPNTKKKCGCKNWDVIHWIVAFIFSLSILLGLIGIFMLAFANDDNLLTACVILIVSVSLPAGVLICYLVFTLISWMIEKYRETRTTTSTTTPSTTTPSTTPSTTTPFTTPSTTTPFTTPSFTTTPSTTTL